LINVPELKKILLDVVFHTANYLQLNDQDVLNRFLTKDVSNIPLKFNFCLHMFHHYELLASKDTSFHPLKYFNMLENQLINEIKKATVIHCSLKIKPTYFFNSKVMSIITKFDSIADYIHAL
jgi:lipopolysaccharide biosynthesis glycosyltransferase